MDSSHPPTAPFYIIFYTTGTTIHPNLKSKTLGITFPFILNLSPTDNECIYQVYIEFFHFISLSRTTMLSLSGICLSLFSILQSETALKMQVITTHHHVTLPICLSLLITLVMRFRKCFVVCLLPPLQSVLLPPGPVHSAFLQPLFWVYSITLHFGSYCETSSHSTSFSWLILTPLWDPSFLREASGSWSTVRILSAICLHTVNILNLPCLPFVSIYNYTSPWDRQGHIWLCIPGHRCHSINWEWLNIFILCL